MNEVIEAKVESFIYEAKDSLYKIVKAFNKDDDEVILVGYFPLLNINLSYIFEGEFVNHPKFGLQFKVYSYKRKEDTSKDGIVSYLSSDLFKGIGERTATKIYELLGDDAINKIIENKDVLKEIKGFNDTKVLNLYNSIIENRNVEEIYVELYSYGLTPKMVTKLYEKYGNEVLIKIKSNPYRLIYEFEGYGFLKSDALAIKLGYSYRDKIRLEEALIYTLYNVCNNIGYTFLNEIQLINSTYNLLNKNSNEENIISKEELKDVLIFVSNSNRIIKEEDRYYVKYLYDDEIILANKVLDIINDKEKVKKYDLDKLNIMLNEIEENLDIKYTKSQKEAIFLSINSNISIITGGPGTGKTTIIKGILYLLAHINKENIYDESFQNKILLCAPTGRAAKRLFESCGIKAYTIHKALGYNYEGEFSYNEENKFSQSVIIIDESSMIDTSLMANLFKAISKRSKIIIVGDIDQLPSVGPGNVLHDLISSNLIPTTRLTEIMRQAQESDIVKLSIDIKNNHVNYDLFKKREEVFFYSADSKQVLEKIIIFVEAFINKGGNILSDLEILVPMYNGICGIDQINKAIQEKFNDSKEFITRGEKTFKKLDKVLQLQNDPELGIMNGDIGYIKDIEKTEDADYLYIDFDGNMVKYPSQNLDFLTLAYAISIHKSQGSEYKNVIMPIVPSYFVMLKKKLIYTAVSRAKKKLIIIGSFNTLLEGINKEEDKRQTTLEYRLNNKLALNKKVIYINDPSIPFETLGEEGMEDITPYDFM